MVVAEGAGRLSTMQRCLRRALGVMTLALSVSACSTVLQKHAPAETEPPVAASDPAFSGQVPDVDAGRAREWLAGLHVVDRHPVGLPTYDRNAFGTAWTDTDGNGCNQRDDVLLRDVQPGSVVVAEQGACDHDVLAGTWTDPYTGSEMTFDDLKDLSQAQAIQIDHVVPLAEAWVSGAADWPSARRLAYANDLNNLLAVDGPTNAGKGADDPAAWRPKASHQCAYAVRWITVKKRWNLAVDSSEAAALADMLC